MIKDTMDTLVEALNTLRNQGYTENLNLKKSCIVCASRDLSIQPEDFQVDKTYRFEGESNPADSSIVYAISSPKFGIKGVLVNAYGVYADPLTDKMVKKLEYKP